MMKRFYSLLVIGIIGVCMMAYADEYNNGTIKSVTNATKSSEKYKNCDVYIWNGTATSIKVSAQVQKETGYHDALTTSFWECILNDNTTFECPHYTTNINATIAVSKLTKDYNSIRFKLENALAGTPGWYDYYVTNTIYIRKAQLVTITWKNYDGSTLSTSKVAIGATPSYTGSTPTRASTAQYSYTFKGWTPTIVAATANTTYTATYTQALRKYAIKFVNEDGTVLQNTQVAYGSTPSYTGSTPTKASTAQYTYTFKGWNPAITSVTGNKTYTAQFDSTKVVYNINVTVDDPTHGIVNVTGNPNYGETMTLTVTPADCYAFTQWSDGNTDNPRTITVTGDATYTAEFEQVHYVIRGQNDSPLTGGSVQVVNP